MCMWEIEHAIQEDEIKRAKKFINEMKNGRRYTGCSMQDALKVFNTKIKVYFFDFETLKLLTIDEITSKYYYSRKEMYPKSKWGDAPIYHFWDNAFVCGEYEE